MKPCPCGSGKAFADCCEPFLAFRLKPRTVRQLVRARYCAYALGAGTHREFLIRTWHPATARNISIADLSNDNIVWKSLDILSANQQGDRGQVEFRASYTEGDGPEQVHHERSVFQRIKGQWLYLEGDVLNT